MAGTIKNNEIIFFGFKAIKRFEYFLLGITSSLDQYFYQWKMRECDYFTKLISHRFDVQLAAFANDRILRIGNDHQMYRGKKALDFLFDFLPNIFFRPF